MTSPQPDLTLRKTCLFILFWNRTQWLAEVFTTMRIHTVMLWSMTSCSLVDMYQVFGLIHCSHVQGNTSRWSNLTLLCWDMRRSFVSLTSVMVHHTDKMEQAQNDGCAVGQTHVVQNKNWHAAVVKTVRMFTIRRVGSESAVWDTDYVALQETGLAMGREGS